MTNTEKDRNFLPKWLKFLVIFILVIGISLRFTNLDLKPYWGDESLSSQRIAGYTNEEFKKTILRSQAIGAEEIVDKYQSPNSERSFNDAMNAFKSKSEHPPLYYVMARLWMQLWGDRAANPRSLSVVISLLIFPSIYWLCGELFTSRLVSSLAVAIVAISPIHLIYAQEARQYSLWAFSILLSSWALLRAIRTNSPLHWGIYTISLALTLYTHLLSIVVGATHGLYVIIIQKFRWQKTTFSYLVASFIGYLIFVPWLLIFFAGRDRSSLASEKAPLASLLQNLFLNLSRIFYDFNSTFSYQKLILYLLFIGLILYALYFLVKNTHKKTWLLIIILIFIPFILLFGSDVMASGKRFALPRYYIPCILGIQIAIAHFFASKISHWNERKKWQNMGWSIILLAVTFSSLSSCFAYTQANTWWHKSKEYYHSEVGQIVNQTFNPLVLATWYEIRSLSHSLKPNVALQDARFTEKINTVAENYQVIFIYKDKKLLKHFLNNNPDYQVTDTYEWQKRTSPINTTKTNLWQLKIKGKEGITNTKNKYT